MAEAATQPEPVAAAAAASVPAAPAAENSTARLAVGHTPPPHHSAIAVAEPAAVLLHRASEGAARGAVSQVTRPRLPTPRHETLQLLSSHRLGGQGHAAPTTHRRCCASSLHSVRVRTPPSRRLGAGVEPRRQQGRVLVFNPTANSTCHSTPQLRHGVACCGMLRRAAARAGSCSHTPPCTGLCTAGAGCTSGDATRARSEVEPHLMASTTWTSACPTVARVATSRLSRHDPRTLTDQTPYCISSN